MDIISVPNLKTIHLKCSRDYVNTYIYYGYISRQEILEKDANINDFFNLCHVNSVPLVVPDFDVQNFCIISFIKGIPTIDINESSEESETYELWSTLITLPHIQKQIYKLNRSCVYLCDYYEGEIRLIKKILHGGGGPVKTLIKTLLDIDNNQITDIWCLHQCGGLVKLNSSAGLDLMKQVIYHTNGLTHTHQFLDCIFDESYLVNMRPSITNLVDMFNQVQHLDTMEEYVALYSHYAMNDSDYYNNQINTFKEKLTRFFVMVTSDNLTDVKSALVEFTSDFKSQISVELAMVYHWLRVRPQIRLQIYRKFPNHPYIQLIKNIHWYFACQNDKETLDANFVYKYLTARPILTGLNVPLCLLFDALKTRHQLFSTFRELKDDKHIPLKVFFDKIFIMEHLSQLI